MSTISVIIPTHDRPRLLVRAVESARAAGTEVEVIVVDDASIDETAEVCRRLRGINYVRLERNQGVGGARNIGLMASTGEYVAFLDDDDLRLPGSLDLQAAALDENADAGFVCGAAGDIDRAIQRDWRDDDYDSRAPTVRRSGCSAGLSAIHLDSHCD